MWLVVVVFVGLASLSILGCFILAPDPTTTLSVSTISAFVVGCILTCLVLIFSLKTDALITTELEALIVMACGGRLTVMAVELRQRRSHKRKASSAGPLPVS